MSEIRAFLYDLAQIAAVAAFVAAVAWIAYAVAPVPVPV